ncbi:hypothetical protein O181_108527 [Austropuccinia psidii MF-1]|uniref:Uncharacterized protein n=1 Tax=Austropuccinia psidii MF-1 TaxID=1389203 RepID=A0A9Q3JUD2_9BASI|nr:hypothetical protein [Austropuccinia psidii MF-1]
MLLPSCACLTLMHPPPTAKAPRNALVNEITPALATAQKPAHAHANAQAPTHAHAPQLHKHPNPLQGVPHVSPAHGVCHLRLGPHMLCLCVNVSHCQPVTQSQRTSMMARYQNPMVKARYHQNMELSLTSSRSIERKKKIISS